MMLAVLLPLLAVAVAQDATSQLWPIPQEMNCAAGSLTVPPSFLVTTNSNSATLASAIQRYNKIYQDLIGGEPATPTAGGLTSMVINVQSGDESLTPATNYS